MVQKNESRSGAACSVDDVPDNQPSVLNVDAPFIDDDESVGGGDAPSGFPTTTRRPDPNVFRCEQASFVCVCVCGTEYGRFLLSFVY